jgi:hypothetical protein
MDTEGFARDWEGDFPWEESDGDALCGFVASESTFGNPEWPASPGVTEAEAIMTQSDESPLGLSPGARAKTSAKPNKTKKGNGADGKHGEGRDEYDAYPFKSGHFFKLLEHSGAAPPTTKLLFQICKLVEEGRWEPNLETRNRWAKRRKANAYAWLDRNEGALTDSDFLRLYSEAKCGLPSRKQSLRSPWAEQTVLSNPTD